MGEATAEGPAWAHAVAGGKEPEASLPPPLLSMSMVGPLPESEQPPSEDEESEATPAGFRAQAARMPPLVRRLLLEGAAPCEVSAAALLEALRLPEEAHEAALVGLQSSVEEALLSRPRALDAAACASLRAAVEASRRRFPDTVDGEPDHQLNVDRAQLEGLIGRLAVEALFALPAELLAGPGRHSRAADAAAAPDAEMFIRRYTPGTRPWNPFHTDSAAVTVNVALGDDCSFEGGRLLVCCGGSVRALERSEGEATVHSSTLLHGVSALARGARYSLIMFFGQPRDEACHFTAESRQAEALALAQLMADRGFTESCAETLSAAQCATLRRNYEVLLSAASVGSVLERVVGLFGAPHLRPSHVARRAREGEASASWSAFALLNYAMDKRCLEHSDGKLGPA